MSTNFPRMLQYLHTEIPAVAGKDPPTFCDLDSTLNVAMPIVPYNVVQPKYYTMTG